MQQEKDKIYKALEQPKTIDNASCRSGDDIAARLCIFSYKQDTTESVTGTRPVELDFNGDKYPLAGKWANLPEQICAALESVWPGKIKELVASGKVPGMALNEKGLRRGTYVPEAEIWYEKNCSSCEFVRKTRSLCKFFGVPLENISITLERTGRFSICQYGDSLSHRVSHKASERAKEPYVADGGTSPVVLPNASRSSSKELSRATIIPPAGLAPQMSPAMFLDDLARDIRVEYPSGFDFKETSRRLVGERVGKSFGDAEADRLKGQMFQCADGLWLFPDMVISDDALRRMKERARGFLSEDGYFSMDALHAEFEAEMRNIDDGRDFDAFFAKFVAGDVRGVVRGHAEWRVCFAASMSEASGWETIVRRIREVLKDCGDAVPVEDIIVQMPSLVRGVAVRLARKQMEDAVVFVAGGVEYIKLLESYYLPADFSEVVSGFVGTTEASQNVVSVVLLEAELDGRYGDGFRVNYGLEDDSVFKQVVAKSFTGKDHGWNRDMFTRNGRRGESNVAEVFMKGHRDKFHEEDFFRYALESRGMKNRGMLILTFLRKHCIRLSRDWWISTDSFEARFGMGDAQYHQVGLVLNEVVGNNRFVPISSLGEDVYDRFPRLECEGKEYPWNPYLLTSVALHKVRNAKVVNDEPSPYTVTAMILPHTAEIIGDVVEYVLGTFPKGYFNDVDSAFRYLKMNNVRLTKTEKLVAKIKVILGIQ